MSGQVQKRMSFHAHEEGEGHRKRGEKHHESGASNRSEDGDDDGQNKGTKKNACGAPFDQPPKSRGVQKFGDLIIFRHDHRKVQALEQHDSVNCNIDKFELFDPADFGTVRARQNRSVCRSC